MRTSLKLLHKKRGDRSTLPQAAASLAEALIDAALTLGGAMVLVWLGAGYWAEWLAGRPPANLWPLALIGTAALACLSIGLVRLVVLVLRFATTAERRSAFATHASGLERRRRGSGNERLPNVPSDADLSNSPGTQLRYRLPCGGRNVLALLHWGWVSLVLAMVTSGCLSVALSYPAGSIGQILLLLGSGSGALVGGWSIWHFLGELIPWFRCGPTCFEVSQHPWLPGQKVEIFVGQFGRMRLRQVDFALECVEIALFQQGTDARRETRVVGRWSICEEERLEITPRKPWQRTVQFEVPSQAMHSFVASSNAIQWRLVLRARGIGTPNLYRDATVILYPPDVSPHA